MKKDLGAKTLVYPTPVLVISTYDKEGNSNAMTAAWGGICCSSPPCVAISLRKATYTYDSLMDRKAFTINIPSEKYIKEADYFGMVSGKKEDKFAKTGLTPIKSEFVDAPFIDQFPINIECKIIQINELGLHTQFIGEVMNVKIDDIVHEGDVNQPIIEQIRPLLFAPDSRNYYGVGEQVAKAFSIGKEIK
ncbi:MULTISPECIES: flavin reductase family protein [Clostridium]|uniref:Flavoredoxin Flr n=1 Tax=Clostridium saccharoperbutylacetonicum N1-4(HMT) TaxID=931276 RepID=M1LS93_9CLOT|nr:MULTISPECIES: flavin reductase family protein [Clostridium]AGF55815.1 flavoredoxin Flr [Clostridium saccharoperbutylacetonicum N1-4(HMT)]AQR94544.1 flavoredoxin [Clostridium saccharoperbutylacetonicum]NRT63451.1 flavin reductase (DIM6/NTAB) family NADH-FMN oxidoreductase RutF [Clostridium saccharoperbutylacetonicum]NSB26813.1 flavin reductase (DIM6/NTAB) family NADH-FMN oxidoreductase RutF [Clostridium saccharoperbutylacetonicum]NSB30380.1 flavin reductase (DIM6/NTAB) family NADH-FMN oxidor